MFLISYFLLHNLCAIMFNSLLFTNWQLYLFNLSCYNLLTTSSKISSSRLHSLFYQLFWSSPSAIDFSTYEITGKFYQISLCWSQSCLTIYTCIERLESNRLSFHELSALEEHLALNWDRAFAYCTIIFSTICLSLTCGLQIVIGHCQLYSLAAFQTAIEHHRGMYA